MGRLTVAIFVSAIFVGIVLTGCGGGGSSSAPAPVPTPSPPTFQVQTISPADQQQLNSFPDEIAVTFSVAPDSSSIDENSVSVIQSGGDDDFSNGNETIIVWNTVLVSGSVATFDFSGTNLNDDSYQVTLRGSGGANVNVVADTNGNTLDGDADGSADGDFISTFTVMAAAPSGATLSSIQSSTFTVSCAVSGCHAGSTPSAGMNLSAGVAFTNIVGISSSEVPDLQRVNPGAADDSYLVQKVEDTAAVGARMPLGGQPLSSVQIQNIRDWINNGALDN